MRPKTLDSCKVTDVAVCFSWADREFTHQTLSWITVINWFGITALDYCPATIFTVFTTGV